VVALFVDTVAALPLLGVTIPSRACSAGIGRTSSVAAAELAGSPPDFEVVALWRAAIEGRRAERELQHPVEHAAIPSAGKPLGIVVLAFGGLNDGGRMAHHPEMSPSANGEKKRLARHQLWLQDGVTGRWGVGDGITYAQARYCGACPSSRRP